MARHIDADKAVEKMDCLFRLIPHGISAFMAIGYNHAVADCIAIIKNIITVDGYWKHDDESPSFYCSACGRHAYGAFSEIYTGEYKYCPFCGAEMKSEENDE